MGRLTVALAALLLANALPTALAHEPDADHHEVALATPDPPTVDGALTDDAWEDNEVEDTVFKFDSPNDGDTEVTFVWDPDGEYLFVSAVVSDESDDAADDWLDFAFAFDHADEDADDGDQRIVRVHRDGTEETVSVEDDGDVTAGEPAEFDVSLVDDPGNEYVVEMRIEWEETLAGFALWQEDNGDDVQFPDGADREDPTTWTNVQGEKMPIDLRVTADKTTAKWGDTVELTGIIEGSGSDNFDELTDYNEDIVFQRYNLTTNAWQTIATKDPDDEGEATQNHKISQVGANRFRIITSDSDLYAAGQSAEVVVNVADLATKVFGAADAWARYTADGAGRRTYILVANASNGKTPTWEASADGTSWERLSAGDEGTALTTSWTPPDHGRWHVRAVTYDDGEAAAGTARELASYTLPGTKIATSVELNVAIDGPNGTLTATVSPAAATGTVTFTRAPDTRLGTATLSNGVATLDVDEMLPGDHTYVARYEGSTTHAASADRATGEWWPEDEDAFVPRTRDTNGETVAVEADDGEEDAPTEIRFTALSDGVGLPGAVVLVVTPPGGEPETLDPVFTTQGAATATYTPPAPGTHAVEARFYRADGDGVVADSRNTTFDVAAVAVVEVALEAPSTATAGDEVEVTVAVANHTGGNVTLLVDGEALESHALDAGEDEVVFVWVPDGDGPTTLRARFQPPAGDTVQSAAKVVTVSAAGGDGDADGEPKTPLPLVVALAALALGAVAWRRRR